MPGSQRRSQLDRHHRAVDRVLTGFWPAIRRGGDRHRRIAVGDGCDSASVNRDGTERDATGDRHRLTARGAGREGVLPQVDADAAKGIGRLVAVRHRLTAGDATGTGVERHANAVLRMLDPVPTPGFAGARPGAASHGTRKLRRLEHGTGNRSRRELRCCRVDDRGGASLGAEWRLDEQCQGSGCAQVPGNGATRHEAIPWAMDHQNVIGAQSRIWLYALPRTSVISPSIPANANAAP